MRLGVVGAGHVGLVTGASLAHLGHTVTCVDRDADRVADLHQGVLPFHEPGLQEIVAQGLQEGRLAFTTDIREAVQESQVLFICVDTPSLQDGSTDMASVEAAVREIAGHLREYKVIVEKSTVPVHTGEWILRTLRLYARPGVEFDVASVPEFLSEGTAVENFLHPDRVVLGVESPRAETLLRELFQPLGAPLVVTNMKSAELIKHASNSFLALKISYINAIASICDLAGADVAQVAEGMGYDRRIGRAFLNAGLGYGGSCFPKDVAAFHHIAQELGYDFQLLRDVAAVNEEQKVRLVRKVKEALWVLRGKTIGVLGLAFKPNTDDLRSAPALDVIELLLKEGAQLQVYDPAALDRSRSLLGERVRYCSDPYTAAAGAHALVIATEWDEFRRLDLHRVRQAMAVPVLVDGRNIFERRAVEALGFRYLAMGR